MPSKNAIETAIKQHCLRLNMEYTPKSITFYKGCDFIPKQAALIDKAVSGMMEAGRCGLEVCQFVIENNGNIKNYDPQYVKKLEEHLTTAVADWRIDD